MLNNFIYAQSKAMFEERIAEVPNDAIVFIEDTKEIWTHGTYFDCSTLDPNIIPNLQTEIAELRVNANDKADTNGTYPDMTVGTAEMAETLGGRPFINNAEFTFRATADKDNSVTDGMATITKLMGNSVVWNNMVDTRDKVGISGWVHENDFLHLVQGHKYAMLRSKAMDALYCIPVIDGVEVYDYVMRDGTYAVIFTSQYDSTPSNTRLYSHQESGACCLVDLTLMFGVDNEPTTIEEYNARKPIVADEYAYNAGELLHSQVYAIKSVGDNAWDEQWENGGIRESNGEEYASASHIRSGYIRVLPDTQYYFKKPIGVLTYLYYYDADKNFVGYADPFATSGEGGVFTTLNATYMRFTCLQADYNNDIMVTLVHSGWKVDTDAEYQPYWEDTLEIDPRIRAAFPDGMMLYDYAFNRNGKGVIVKATEVVDGEVAKKGAPEVYEFDQPFNFDYRVADFGTEEVVAAQASAALRVKIEYGFNAYDTIVTNKLAVQELTKQIGSLSVDWESIENKPFYETVTNITDLSSYDTGNRFEIPVTVDEYTTIVVTGRDYETSEFNFVLNQRYLSDTHTDSESHQYIAILGNGFLSLESDHDYLSSFHSVQITVLKPLDKKYIPNISKLTVENDNKEEVYIYESNTLNQLVIGADDGMLIHTSGAETVISNVGIDTYGSVSATNGFFQTSDANLKNFSDPISVDLEKLSTLKKHYFTWKTGGDQQIGVCAQEIQELYPEIVNQSNDGTLSVDYTKLSVIALKAIDVLNNKNKEIESRLEKLEKLLNNE